MSFGEMGAAFDQVFAAEPALKGELDRLVYEMEETRPHPEHADNSAFTDYSFEFRGFRFEGFVDCRSGFGATTLTVRSNVKHKVDLKDVQRIHQNVFRLSDFAFGAVFWSKDNPFMTTSPVELTGLEAHLFEEAIPRHLLRIIERMHYGMLALDTDPLGLICANNGFMPKW